MELYLYALLYYLSQSCLCTFVFLCQNFLFLDHSALTAFRMLNFNVTGEASRLAFVFAVDKYKTANAPQCARERRLVRSRPARSHHPNVAESDLKLASRALKYKINCNVCLKIKMRAMPAAQKQVAIA